MNRAVTVSAASGSLSALIWQVVHEFLQQPAVCPLPEVLPALVADSQAAFTFSSLGELTIDLPSLALGILLGLAIGPFLDFCFLLRQGWRSFVKSKLAQLSKQHRSPLYRLG